MTKSPVVAAVLFCVAAAASSSAPLAQNRRSRKSGDHERDGDRRHGRRAALRMMLILDGGRIEYVGRMGDRRIPQNALVYDMSGHIVIPGLIEAHTHLVALAAVSRASESRRTFDPARAIGVEKTYGTIERRKLANLVT